ncbi:MAG: ankyrin repeat domain-containing protein [Nitrospirota bacterium]|nr:ankyrin repeat domain-containing protein [Nitrospirota bacterium]
MKDSSEGRLLLLYIFIAVVLTIISIPHYSYANANDDLKIAAKKGDIKKIKDAMLKGADVDHRDSGYFAALMYSVAYGHVEAVKLLLDYGADVNTNMSDDGGVGTVLHFAVAIGSPKTKMIFPSIPPIPKRNIEKIIILLITRGADINARNKKGGTPLIMATVLGNIEVVKLLLAKGADVNAKTSEGYTALMLAEELGNTSLVRLLKQAGAHELNTTTIEKLMLEGDEITGKKVNLCLKRGEISRDYNGGFSFFASDGNSLMEITFTKNERDIVELMPPLISISCKKVTVEIKGLNSIRQLTGRLVLN